MIRIHPRHIWRKCAGACLVLALGTALITTTAVAAAKPPHAKFDARTSKIACPAFTRILHGMTGISTDNRYGATPREYVHTLTHIDSAVNHMVKRLGALHQSRSDEKGAAALDTQLKSFSKEITAVKAAVHARSKSAFRAASKSVNKTWKTLPKRVVGAGIACNGTTPVTGATSPLDSAPAYGTPYGQ